MEWKQKQKTVVFRPKISGPAPTPPPPLLLWCAPPKTTTFWRRPSLKCYSLEGNINKHCYCVTWNSTPKRLFLHLKYHPIFLLRSLTPSIRLSLPFTFLVRDIYLDYSGPFFCLRSNTWPSSLSTPSLSPLHLHIRHIILSASRSLSELIPTWNNVPLSYLSNIATTDLVSATDVAILLRQNL